MTDTCGFHLITLLMQFSCSATFIFSHFQHHIKKTSFCRQYRSRSDCKECAIWSWIYSLCLFRHDTFCWNVPISVGSLQICCVFGTEIVRGKGRCFKSQTYRKILFEDNDIQSKRFTPLSQLSMVSTRVMWEYWHWQNIVWGFGVKKPKEGMGR